MKSTNSSTLPPASGALHRLLSEYASQLGAFRPNARLYLLSVIITGAAMGVFRLLFNFFVLSRGYDEAMLGNLVTTSNLTALIVALPMGYLADLLGRKTSLVVGGLLSSLTIVGMVFSHSVAMLILLNVVWGMAQSLAGVTMGPFLMENSGEKERTYLFSFVSGLQTASAFFGNWLGGMLPTWVASTQQVSATSAGAYGSSLLVIAVCAGLGVGPLFFMNTPRLARSERSSFAPFSYAAQHPVLLGKLILPMLVTSIGAGMIMPFMNVFFRNVHHLSDPAIGAMFAWGSLAMGVGLLIAPPLADRMGKIQLVVVTQSLAIPFLGMLGYSPWYGLSALAYYVRLTLMNMSGPVYQTYVMEHVDASARATVASLVSMANNFGWAFSPTISGWFQVNYGFGPSYLATIVLYSLSTLLYWWFFWYPRKTKMARPVARPVEERPASPGE